MGNAMQQGSPVACDPGSCCRPPGSLRHGSVNAAAGSFGPLKEAAVFCVVGLTQHLNNSMSAKIPAAIVLGYFLHLVFVNLIL